MVLGPRICFGSENLGWVLQLPHCPCSFSFFFSKGKLLEASFSSTNMVWSPFYITNAHLYNLCEPNANIYTVSAFAYLYKRGWTQLEEEGPHSSLPFLSTWNWLDWFQVWTFLVFANSNSGAGYSVFLLILYVNRSGFWLWPIYFKCPLYYEYQFFL